MKNSLGEVIYVGKAKILKNRVRQYFRTSKNHSEKVKAMVKNIAEFGDFLVCEKQRDKQKELSAKSKWDAANHLKSSF